MENYLATLIVGISSILFIGLGLPLANNRVPPNRKYGYRVSRHQLEDEEMWYAINSKGGVHLVLIGCAGIIYTAITLPFIGNATAQIILMIVFTVLLAIVMGYEIAWSVREAKRMAREKGLE